MIDPSEEPICSWLVQEGVALQEVLYKVGNTAVYKAFNSALSRPVALKLLLCMNTSEVEMREAENQRILEHPNVVQIYRYFRLPKDERCWILCMEEELMSSDLSHVIRQRNRSKQHWSEAELRKFVVEMVEVLACAQALGIAHRDIKPQNVLVTGTDFKLGDFGWSRRFRHEEDHYSSLCGTPSYLSPALHGALIAFQKQVHHNPYKSDVFSLGLTILSMLRLHEHPRLNSSSEMLSSTVAGLVRADWLQDFLTLTLQTSEPLRPDFLMLADLLRVCSSRGDPCCHRPSCSRFQACPSCFRPAQFIALCSQYMRTGGLSGTPTGMEACSACRRVMVQGDLVALEAPAGLYCSTCLQIKLDDEEVAERCRSSIISLIYYSMLNAL